MRYTSHEAITSSGNVYDVALIALTITQGTPQLRNVEAQAALLDRHIGPRLCDEFAFLDHLAGLTDQKTKKVECAAAEGNGRPITLQETSARQKAEGPERKYLHERFVIESAPAASALARFGNFVDPLFRQTALLASDVHGKSSWCWQAKHRHCALRERRNASASKPERLAAEAQLVAGNDYDPSLVLCQSGMGFIGPIP
jgi:hypothetical protein